MISEETAQRIAVALERLAGTIERAHPAAPATPMSYSPLRCFQCGGDHTALMCPKLQPKAIGTPPYQWGDL